MDSTPLRNNFPLQSVLTNAFCYLISSMDDYNEIVAQRATLYLGTVHDYAMKVRNPLKNFIYCNLKILLFKSSIPVSSR